MTANLLQSDGTVIKFCLCHTDRSKGFHRSINMKPVNQTQYTEKVQELGFLNTSDCDFLDCQKALEDGKLRELIEKVSGSISLKDQYEDCKMKMSDAVKEFDDYSCTELQKKTR